MIKKVVVTLAIVEMLAGLAGVGLTGTLCAMELPQESSVCKKESREREAESLAHEEKPSASEERPAMHKAGAHSSETTFWHRFMHSIDEADTLFATPEAGAAFAATFKPFAPKDLPRLLGKTINSSDYFKAIQRFASLLHEEDVAIRQFTKTIVFRRFFMEVQRLSQLYGPTQKELPEGQELEKADPTLVERQDIFTSQFNQIARMMASDPCRASLVGIKLLQTADLTNFCPEVFKLLDIASETMSNKMTTAYTSARTHLQPFENGPSVESCDQAIISYLNPALVSLATTIAHESAPEELVTKLQTPLSQSLSHVSSWYIEHHEKFHQLYSLLITELKKAKGRQQYRYNLFFNELLPAKLSDASPAGASTADQTAEALLAAEHADAIAALLVEELRQQDAERKKAPACSSKSNTHAKKHRNRKRKSADRAVSSATPSPSMPNNSASDSDDEFVETLEFDPNSAFVKSIVAARTPREEKERKEAVSPASSSLTEKPVLVYHARTQLWQTGDLARMCEVSIKRAHTSAYTQFCDIAYHRLPFVLEDILQEHAQERSYTSPTNGRRYDMLTFDGAILIPKTTFHDEPIFAKTIYGTFEISFSAGLPKVIHRCFKPYTDQPAEKAIDTSGDTRTRTCNKHVYYITENERTILIQEAGAPAPVIYVVFKPAENSSCTACSSST